MNKKIVLIMLGAVFLIALPVMMYLVRSNQDTRSGATAGTVDFIFSEPTKNIPANSEFEVPISINPNGVSVLTFEFAIKYNKTQLEFKGFTVENSISELDATTSENGNEARYSFVGSSNPNITTTSVIGKAKFKMLSTTDGTIASVDFLPGAIAANTVGGQTTSFPVNTASTGRYTVGSGNSTNPVNFFFEPASVTIQPGQSTTLALKVNTNGKTLNSFGATISYPSNSLSIVTKSSDFTAQSGISYPQSDLTAGQLILSGVKAGGVTGSSVTLATIKFTAPSSAPAGSKTVGLTIAGIDPNNPKSSTPATITIGTGNTSTCTGDDRPASCTCTEDPDCATGLTCQGTTGSKTCKTPPTGLTCGTPSIPPATGFAPLTVSLHGGAGDGVPADSIAGYQWDFDGNGSWDSTTQKEPITHIYTTAGTFNPKFRIQSTNGSYSTTCAYPYSVVATASQTGDTGLRVSFSLPGIGPRANQGENPTPKRANRQVTIMLYNSSNQPLASGAKTGTAAYNPTTGVYNGVINLGANFTTGNYIAKIKVDNSLYKRLPGIVNITSGSLTNNSGPVKLVTGDIDQNNSLTVIDYTDVAKCYQGSSQCTNAMKPLADTNDNGITEDDIKDFVIMQSGFATREGD